MSTVSMREMLEAGVHFGHRTRFWNPKMAPYIYGARDKIHIINLEKTLPMFDDALRFAAQVIRAGGKILFVGTKRASQEIIREQASRCGMPYVDHRWLGGMLTNYKTVRQSIKRLRHLEKMRDDGVFGQMIKKEALQMQRQLEKLQRSIGGIKDMGGLPEALFIIDVNYENIAVQEASRLRIPIVGIVDSNSNPENIAYPVPGNDDSRSAILLYVKAVTDAIIEVQDQAAIEAEERKEQEEREKQEKAKAAKVKITDKKAEKSSRGAEKLSPAEPQTTTPSVSDNPEDQQ